MLSPGTILQNRYQIVGLLGQGGMGAVYRAWDMRLNVHVAIKEMIPQPGIDPKSLAQLRQQFQQEATILARLSHPHLVRVGDFFEESGNAYLVMDFVEGQSLADLIARQGPLPEHQVLEWARQLLDALAYCHSQGVIHRDIKPQNVIIRPDGRAVLVDFGLVKLWDPRDPRTRTVVHAMGTPEYAPPEQYDLAGHTDPRSDLYSLGATLYHALTGQLPATATIRMSDPDRFRPPRMLMPRITPRTEQVILKAMELNRSHRWSSAAEMARALGVPISVGFPTPPSPPPTRRPPAPTPQPGPRAVQPVPTWVWVMGGVAVFMLVIALLGMSRLRVNRGGGSRGGSPTPSIAAILPGGSMTPSPTLTRTLTVTSTPTRTPTPTSTPTRTPTPTSTPTRTPTSTPRPPILTFTPSPPSPTEPPPPPPPEQPTQPPPPPPEQPTQPPPPTEYTPERP